MTPNALAALLILAPLALAFTLLAGALIGAHQTKQLSEHQHQLIGRYHAKETPQ